MGTLQNKMFGDIKIANPEIMQNYSCVVLMRRFITGMSVSTKL
jgi:hypothetical protein